MLSSGVLLAPVPALPQPIDVADVWLVHALEHLQDACKPVDADHRLDASRRAVALAALAVEARMNRVLREHDPENWLADVQLTQLEKFQCLPRLLHEHDLRQHNELAELLVELFDLRDGLVDATLEPVTFTPATACAMVTAAAALCSFLGDEVAVGQAVHARATAMAALAAAASEAELPGGADERFPPDLIGA